MDHPDRAQIKIHPFSNHRGQGGMDPLTHFRSGCHDGNSGRINHHIGVQGHRPSPRSSASGLP